MISERALSVPHSHFLFPFVQVAHKNTQTIVSQDVSLFTGTIRTNLDPFTEHSDEECWDVLERCHIASVLSHASARDGTATPAVNLETPISQTGSLSAGERQLVALARAVLRRSNVVIMDEATSQIDALLDDHVRLSIIVLSDRAAH
jgi:ABC-type multidrug transport system fused ATPase/permease subunit